MSAHALVDHLLALLTAGGVGFVVFAYVFSVLDEKIPEPRPAPYRDKA